MQDPTPAKFPTGEALLAAAITSAGPVIGPYALMAVLAFLGAMVALSLRPPTSLMAGLLFLFRSVVLACVLTGMVVWVAAAQLGMPSAELLVPCAFFIGWRHDWALAWLGRKFGVDKDGPSAT